MFIPFYGRVTGRPLSHHKKSFLDKAEGFVLDPRCIPMDRECVMEIGFGHGEHLLHQIKKNADSFFIGVEVFKNGIAHFLEHLDEKDYGRVRLFSQNVHILVPQIADQTISQLFILFPDPWPKKRHEKRRLLQLSFLKECHRILKPCGLLTIATDMPFLMLWMSEQIVSSQLFQWKKGIRYEESNTWPDWPLPQTRYQKKALLQGRRSAFCLWRKNDC